MTKEERRAKYTEIARKRRQKLELRRHGGRPAPNKVCYRCRGVGHSVSNCPNKSKEESVLCYRCGSTEHALAACPQTGQDLPFATCFLCHQKGHLVSKCPQNQRGIFIHGGSCRHCGSKDHRAGECKERSSKRKESQEEDWTSPFLEEPAKKKSDKKEKIKKKKRVVKF